MGARGHRGIATVIATEGLKDGDIVHIPNPRQFLVEDEHEGGEQTDSAVMMMIMTCMMMVPGDDGMVPMESGGSVEWAGTV